MSNGEVTPINKISIPLRPGECLKVNGDPLISLVAIDPRAGILVKSAESGELYRWSRGVRVDIGPVTIEITRVRVGSQKADLYVYCRAEDIITREAAE